MAISIPRILVEHLNGPDAGSKASVGQLPATIGTSSQADIQLRLAGITGEQGRLDQDGDRLIFIDSGSIHGTIHRRGSSLTPLGGRLRQAELWNEDVIEFGDPANPVKLKVLLEEAPTSGVITRRSIDEAPEFTAQVTQHSGRLAALVNHSAELQTGQTIQQVFEAGARLAMNILPAASHVTITQNAGAGEFPVVLSQTRSGDTFDGRISRTLMTEVVQSRKGLLLTNAAAQMPNALSILQTGLASTLCVPLWSNSDIQGVLQVDNRSATGVFTGADLEALTVAGRQIALAAENARLVERLEATRDKLSGQNDYLRTQSKRSGMGMIGESPAIQEVMKAIKWFETFECQC